ncbi:UPF0769 protein C21orf59 homolog [Octodon degus]|uniref:UPF0769 protein C21orf59 homolog n=1 Tax=Octodon degus TaxID=10160 RepID=A0A6P3VE66_OCTDE|nr:UPF0769 protein C21orf59 homolog [Octodon degus]
MALSARAALVVCLRRLDNSHFRERDREFRLAPNEKMKQVIKKTIEEAKAIISKKQVEAGVCVTMAMVKDALDQLRGAVMIVYPMGLPSYDPIRMEFEDKEDLSGTQAGLSVITESEAQLWWAAKELRRTKKLSDYVGKNEKTKIIVKIQQRGQGAPAREPIISSEEQKQLMLYYHRRQEEPRVATLVDASTGASGAAMVLLHVKRGDESQFLLQAPGSTELEELTVQVTRVYNGRLKVQRLCSGATGEAEETGRSGLQVGQDRQGSRARAEVLSL